MSGSNLFTLLIMSRQSNGPLDAAAAIKMSGFPDTDVFGHDLEYQSATIANYLGFIFRVSCFTTSSSPCWCASTTRRHTLIVSVAYLIVIGNYHHLLVNIIIFIYVFFQTAQMTLACRYLDKKKRIFNHSFGREDVLGKSSRCDVRDTPLVTMTRVSDVSQQCVPVSSSPLMGSTAGGRARPGLCRPGPVACSVAAAIPTAPSGAPVRFFPYQLPSP